MAKQIGLGVVVDFSSAKQGFEQIEKGMSKARESSQKFGNVLGGLGTEMGSVGRIAGTLGGILAAGSVWGAAAAGVTALIGYFRDLSKEQEAAIKKTAELVASARTATNAISALRAELAGDKVGAAQAESNAGIEKAALNVKAQREALEKLIEDQGGFLSTITPGSGQEAYVAKWKAAQAAIATAEEELRQATLEGEKKVRDAQEAVSKERLAALDKESQKTSQALQKDTDAWRQYLAQNVADDVAAEVEKFNRAAANARAIKNEREALHQEELRDRLVAEANAEKARVDLKNKGALTPERSARIDADLTRALDRIGTVYEEKLTEYLKRLGEKLREAQTDTSGYEEDGARMDDYWKLKAQDFQDAQAKMRAELQQTAASAQQWGTALGNIFGQLATKQMTLGQAMASIGQMIIQSVTQAAIASITADASRAAAGAAASQAGIPIVGPVLAISAMGAMLAAVMGLIGNVGSAAGGAVLPGSGGPFPFVLHPNETVLPADLSLGMQELIADGGPGGGTTVVIQALDTKSFYQALKRNDPELIKVINEARADRRL